MLILKIKNLLLASIVEMKEEKLIGGGGKFVDLPAYYKEELKVKAPSLFNSITRYYGEHIIPEEKELISRISEMCKDIAEAPTGGVDENFNIRPLKDQFSNMFIRILAGHLVANGWVKEDK